MLSAGAGRGRGMGSRALVEKYCCLVMLIFVKGKSEMSAWDGRCARASWRAVDPPDEQVTDWYALCDGIQWGDGFVRIGWRRGRVRVWRCSSRMLYFSASLISWSL